MNSEHQIMNKKRPIVAVDLDEVLGEFITPLVKFHNAVYPDAPRLSATSFFSYKFADVWGGTRDEAIAKVHEFFDSEYFEDIPVVSGAKDGVQALLKAGYRLVVVTSRQYEIERQTREWIQRHFADCFEDIAFGNHWGMSGGKVSKVALCQDLGAECLIDDSVDYAMECGKTGLRVLLFGDYAWNASEDEINPLPPTVQRVPNWAQVVEELARRGREI
jgi:5'(3')-deoxyribonucleotidase